MSDGPLAGSLGTAGDAPAARAAGELLAGLGAAITLGTGTEITLGPRAVHAPADSRVQAWSRSGFTSAATGAPGTLAQACAALLDVLADRPLRADGPELLDMRAVLLGFDTAGAVSAGGTARLLRAADGWAAVQLSRPEDVDLVPALIEEDGDGEPWSRVRTWLARHPTAELIERVTLLGLAAGALGTHPAPAAPWRIRRLGRAGADDPAEPHLVVNLGSLWAAPLCAQLLRRSGLRVIDVESPGRPDGSRLGTPDFYAALHAGHERAVIDLGSSAGKGGLTALLAAADVVITGSRGASLQRLGALPPEQPARKQVWVSVTGYGLSSERVAFGDDAAVAGGLVAYGPAGEPHFLGDALADPLTGMAAAVAALACLRARGSWHVDVALADVAAYAASMG